MAYGFKDDKTKEDLSVKTLRVYADNSVTIAPNASATIIFPIDEEVIPRYSKRIAGIIAIDMRGTNPSLVAINDLDITVRNDKWCLAVGVINTNKYTADAVLTTASTALITYI